MGLGISSAKLDPVLAGFEADQVNKSLVFSSSALLTGSAASARPDWGHRTDCLRTASLRKGWLLVSALLLVSGCGVIERGGFNQAPSRSITRYERYSEVNGAVMAMPPLAEQGQVVSSGGAGSTYAAPGSSNSADAYIQQPSAYMQEAGNFQSEYESPNAQQQATATQQPYLDLSADQQSFSSQDIGRQVRSLIAKRAETHPDWARTLDRFYSSYGYQPIWYRGAWSKEAKVAQASLAKSWADGLPPRRYVPAEGIDLSHANTLASIARTELALTQGMILYLPELREGLTAGSQNGLPLLEAALASGDFATALERLRPQDAQFQGLRKAVLTKSMDDSAKRLIALNMHRFRTAQEQAGGRRVRVNLPGYNLDVFDGQRHVMSMPVIVGQPDRATPVLRDQIVNLKFSPDWSVPPIAAGEDLLPLLKHDARALVDKMGLQAFRRGKAVDPLSVNWNRYSASNLPYTFRQRPGPKNAMGGVRFSLTNPQDIYLHDTPERELFSEKVRMISSGCVRVADAEKLASWILAQDQGWSRSQVKRAMGSGKTHIQLLKQPVAVDLVYYTALIDPQGELKLYPDVYGKDAELAAQLGI